VALGFWSLAPPARIADLLGADPSAPWLENLKVSSELLLVPALVLLAVAVGIFPAMAAYRIDVAQGLEK
jgi:putative ABC transport system permease protein